MSVYFCSDLHLGHKNIALFREFIDSKQDNTDQIVKSWNETITKNDVVYCLGDIAFDTESLNILGNLKGRKILIKGNHDDMVSTKEQCEVFEEIYGMIKYKGLWLTHCPIHPCEMRGRRGNVHGHTHDFDIKKNDDPSGELDTRYLNCSVDSVWRKKKSVFYTLDYVKSYFGF
jgi:calcineurin-like phosphoesterase family protein